MKRHAQVPYHTCIHLVLLCALRLLDEKIHVFRNNFSGYLYMRNSESNIMIQVMLPSLLHSFLKRNYCVERILDSCTWKDNWKGISGKQSVCFHLAREHEVEEERHVGFWGFKMVVLQEISGLHLGTIQGGVGKRFSCLRDCCQTSAQFWKHS